MDEKTKAKAILCQIYHHSIHNRYTLARDYLLMTRIQSLVSTSDVHLQIFYNRVLIQLGLCAFRLGLISEAHTALVDICTSGKLRFIIG